jgi:hypothetical protein
VTVARLLAVALALCAWAAAGCGLGPGDDAGQVDLTVSRDYGERPLVQKEVSITESDTVLRVLDRNADVETRYGGGFVQSIDGIAGGTSGGRRTDWFFYVNGIESPVGSTGYRPQDGDRIWWDYRDWTSAMRVPAVVGSWPEPLVHGFRDERWVPVVQCLGALAPCEEANRRLRAAGVPSPVPSEAGGSLPVQVGTWDELRKTAPASLLAGDPSSSGVFATFSGGRRALLTLLDARGAPAGSIGRGGGLVAALRPGEGPPTWVVTGTDPEGVEAAVSLLGDDLRDRYAVAVESGGEPTGVPVP